MTSLRKGDAKLLGTQLFLLLKIIVFKWIISFFSYPHFSD